MTGTTSSSSLAGAGWAGDRGQISVGTAGVFLMLIVLAALLYDPGMTIAARVAALDTAQAAARTGADQLDLTLLRTAGIVQIDPAAAHAAATTFLQQTGTDAVVSATTDQVTVTITHHRPTVLLGIVGVDTLPVEVSATAQPRTDDNP